jgi:DNA-binding PadR family transcriptional regulator
MRGEALKGHLDLLLLSTLEGGPAHGYAVIEALAQQSAGQFELPEGTVYPALHRLELDGQLRSKWSTGAGRRRRVYSLTPAGRRRLESGRRDWTSFAGAVKAVLRAPG